jgi:hypothetical protein
MSPTNRRVRFSEPAILALLLVPALALAQSARTAKPAAKIPLSASIKTQITTALDQLVSDADFAGAKTSLTQAFDQAIAHGTAKDLDAFRDAAFALRLVTQLEKLPSSKRIDTLKYLRANDTLARELVFLIHDKEKVTDVYDLLDRLRKERGEQLDKFATLAAAICVVHDQPLERGINENKVKSPDAVQIFDYYVRFEKQMFFGVKPVPPELLAYVVDTTSSIDEMTWALNNYAGNDKVGRLFFTIKYDYDHYRQGAPKRVTQEGFNLPNILEFGGVCADQAYFAMTVGKAIGVPTAYATGRGGDVGHAWVGFLQAQGRSGWWNFDSGRYEAYKGVKGEVLDPQTRERIPDSYVSLLAELIGAKPADRHAGVALSDAARRLMAVEKAGGEWSRAAPDATVTVAPNHKPRKPTVDAQLELVELALKQCLGDRDSWFVVRDLAKDGKLSLAQKKRWADVLQRLAGQKYPDFLLAILEPMIQTIDDVKEQNALWNAAFNSFRNRADLAAHVRMQQAAMWERARQHDNAGLCYMDVIEQFANAGPFVIEALQRAERTLRSTQRGDRVLALYEDTWSRIKKPSENAFVNQSNWFRVGAMYMERLEQANEPRAAAAVRSQLEATVAGPR